MSTDDYYPFNILCNHLQQAINQQLSGTFLIATDDNASCRFALQQGRLTHSSFRRLHGMEAVEAFSSIQAGRHSFNATLNYPFREHARIDHEAAIVLLGLTMPSAPPPVRAQRLKPVSGSQFTQAELEALFGRFYFE